MSFLQNILLKDVPLWQFHNFSKYLWLFIKKNLPQVSQKHSEHVECSNLINYTSYNVEPIYVKPQKNYNILYYNSIVQKKM